MQVSDQSKQDLMFEISADGFTGNKLELLADISVNGRHSNGTGQSNSDPIHRLNNEQEV